MPRDTFSSLANLTNVTEADLISNRAGQLSATQKEALQNKQRIGMILGIIFGFVLIGFGIFLLVGQSAPDIQVNGVFSLVIGIVVFYYTFKLQRVSADALPVQQVTGYLQKEAIDNNDISHFLIVDEVRLQVTQSFYNTVTEGDPYTFYYIVREAKKAPEALTLISYEPASDLHPKTE